MVERKHDDQQAGMDCLETSFSRHALQRMFKRDVSVDEVREVVGKGEVIISYPDALSPSFLLLGWIEEKPLHVLVARNNETGDCIIVTCYIPDKDRWSEDFRVRNE